MVIHLDHSPFNCIELNCFQQLGFKYYKYWKNLYVAHVIVCNLWMVLTHLLNLINSSSYTREMSFGGLGGTNQTWTISKSSVHKEGEGQSWELVHDRQQKVTYLEFLHRIC